jgi:DNA-directed RNA polymerase subunit RPC12/RpoP
MKLLIYVTKGKAVIQGESLRCASPRPDDPNRICNKLLCKRNEQGQIAGDFRCERCHSQIQVKLATAREDLINNVSAREDLAKS